MASTVLFPSSNPHLSHAKLEGDDTTAANNPQSPQEPPTSSGPDTSNQSHRFMPYEEWAQFCRGVGVQMDGGEANVHVAHQYWPSRGYPDGLYKDVLWEKSKFALWFALLSSLRWFFMIAQLALGATLTALGSLGLPSGTAVTAIGAVNTCVAGLLALMHNTGLPDRYRSNQNEFSKVESHMREIIDTRLVSATEDVADTLAGCFKMFQDAKQTVQNNIPQSYVSVTTSQGKTAVTTTAPSKGH